MDKPEAYSQLAGFYDDFMDDTDYKKWCAFYMEIAGLKKGMRILEAGCGTGLMTAEFLRNGLDVTATDISSEMLSAAGERIRKSGKRAVLARMDMRKLSVHEQRLCDAVISACDGVNYLLSGAEGFFESARKCLKTGGVLAFDISSSEKLAAMDGQVYFDDRDEKSCVWSCAFDRAERALTMDVTVFIKEGERYIRFDEIHTQRAYEAAEISRLLNKSGFSDINIYGDKVKKSPEDGEKRLHFTARKA